MKKPKTTRKHAFLNKNSARTASVTVVSECKEYFIEEPRETYRNFWGVLSITDCHRKVNLDFRVEKVSEKDYRDCLYKIRVLRNALDDMQTNLLSYMDYAESVQGRDK